MLWWLHCLSSYMLGKNSLYSFICQNMSGYMGIFIVIVVIVVVKAIFRYWERKDEREAEQLEPTAVCGNDGVVGIGDTQEEPQRRHTTELLVETLKKMGCKQEEKSDGDFFFNYQGYTFMARADDNYPFISMYMLFFYEFSSYDIEQFAAMQKVINEANSRYDSTVIYVVNKETEKVYLHLIRSLLFIPQIPGIEDYLRNILQDLFRMSNFVCLSLYKDGTVED